MILVTGANGFVGRALCARMRLESLPVRAAYRDPSHASGDPSSVAVGDIGANTDWTLALEGVRSVVHLAARVHVMNARGPEALDTFRRVNVEGTAKLARQAAAAGVMRFVFLSSIKVNGESTRLSCPYTADDPPAPEDPYGVSKHEAEQAIRRIGQQTGMEVVIIRPPLVYGPGVKANFDAMMRWLVRGVPLPLGAFHHNRRSLVALDNLVDLILTCLHHPAAAGQIFLASDGQDLSTVDLLQGMGLALGKSPRLFWVPAGLLKLAAAVASRQAVYQRLGGSLQADISKTRQLLDWTPPLSVEEGLRRVAQGRR